MKQISAPQSAPRPERKSPSVGDIAATIILSLLFVIAAGALSYVAVQVWQAVLSSI